MPIDSFDLLTFFKGSRDGLHPRLAPVVFSKLLRPLLLRPWRFEERETLVVVLIGFAFGKAN